MGGAPLAQRKLWLNLGCGGDYRSSDERVEWINIYVRGEVNPDLLIDLEREFLTHFGDGSVDGILCRDVLEHLSWRVIEDFLQDCLRVLRPRGEIHIQMPDMEAIAKRVVLNPSYRYQELEGWRAISFWIYGSGDYGEKSFHKAGFTIPTLRRLLQEVGFEVREIKNDGGTNIIAVALKP